MSLQENYVIALDVGGTVLKAALTGRDNKALYQARRPTPGAGDPAAVVAGILDFADELRGAGLDRFGRPPAAAGVAVPGIVDERAGVAVYSANLGWRDVPLRRMVSERLDGVPVALGHDVRAGGLAEGRLGAAAGEARFLFVALGTGISGAIGIEGRVEPGARGGAGDLGHVVIRPGGARCGCGQRGCLETVASAAAVGRAWAAASGTPGATAADAARAVADGDPRAVSLWREAVDGLADGLLTAITLLDPATVIVGGGLAEAGETLLAPLHAALAAKATYQRLPTIVPAALGDAAGCLGAGLLAWDHTTLPTHAEVSPS
ncbi:ROK family protein [Streptomyces litchfieldiae]|uniref:ROK family protein n=1 Tax=Streptomyces litchfieldiae TaxID=3075543 RepID=A0ABU2MRT0_9ACTN|nr:ROK family protein [Streptomyces sp. DSM 44938]MDT0343314.1 ROK family protein [Streptomyces sp. DSM 44938]